MEACPGETVLIIGGCRVDAFRACSKPTHLAAFPKLCDRARRGPLPHELHAGRQCGPRVVARYGSNRRYLWKQNRVMTIVFARCVFLLLIPLTLHFVLCRFDISRAYKPTVMQKMKDVFGIGGHVYGYGAYFAPHALYSHWWNTRVWAPAKSVFAV